MSNEVLQQVIARATGEPEFRDLLVNDPAQALQGYELTEDEISALKNLTTEKFDPAAGELEERTSRAGLNLGDTGIGGESDRVKVKFPWLTDGLK